MKLFAHTQTSAFEIVKITPGTTKLRKHKVSDMHTYIWHANAIVTDITGRFLYSNEITAFELYDPVANTSTLIKSGNVDNFLKALTALLTD